MARTVQEEATKLRQNLDKLHTAGRKDEYDRFWDLYQRDDRANYEYAFAGIGWTDGNYNPKYDIIGSIPSAFRGSRITNTKKPIVLTGKQASTSNAFNASYVKTIPSIDLTGATNTSTCFNGANYIEDITFVGTIPTSVNLQSSPVTVATMKSAISALVNYTGTANASTYTLTFSDDCWAALEADSSAPDGGTWRNYVTNVLGWNT